MEEPRKYYVATLVRYVLVDARNAQEAIDLAQNHPLLEGRTILVVRPAAADEIRLQQWADEQEMKSQVKHEPQSRWRQQPSPRHRA
jgi:hypothetical protein